MDAVLGLSIILLSAGIVSLIARYRGLRPKFWVALSVLFSVLVLPFVLFARSGAKPEKVSYTPDLVAMALGIAGIGLTFYWPNIAPYVIGYNCQTMIHPVQELSKQNPLLKIVAIFDPQEVSNDGDGIVCRGDALWSTGAKLPVTYKTFKDHDKWFISYQPG